LAGAVRYRVQLIDPVPFHVEQALEAIARAGMASRATAELGDARALGLANESVDAVLLLGRPAGMRIR
jgi:hypothetical protein